MIRPLKIDDGLYTDINRGNTSLPLFSNDKSIKRKQTRVIKPKPRDPPLNGNTQISTLNRIETIFFFSFLFICGLGVCLTSCHVSKYEAGLILVLELFHVGQIYPRNCVLLSYVDIHLRSLNIAQRASCQ